MGGVNFKYKWRVVRLHTSSLDGATAGWYVLNDQQKRFYFPVVYQESRLMSILFHFEVYMIEKGCSEKRETHSFFFINALKNIFVDWLSSI